MEKRLSRFILFALILSNLSVYANEGLNLDLAILKINKEVKTLNNEILSLKEEIETLRETQRLNSEKITELLQMIQLNQANNAKTVVSKVATPNKKPEKLFNEGKNAFVLGNHEQSIQLFLDHLETSPSPSSVIDTKLWLGRAYFYSQLFLESKEAYLEYQVIGQNHPKFVDSLYELSMVYVELKEIDDAKLLLSRMIEEYSNHSLSSKASALLQSL